MFNDGRENNFNNVHISQLQQLKSKNWHVPRRFALFTIFKAFKKFCLLIIQTREYLKWMPIFFPVLGTDRLLQHLLGHHRLQANSLQTH